MLSPEIMSKLEILAQQVATEHGCEFYDLDFVSVSGRRTLRVYIDRADGGVGIEDCSHVSRGLSETLDAQDPVEGAYDLEVSTPGMERVLRKDWHFQRVVGKSVWLKIDKPLEAYGVQNVKNANAKQMTVVLKAVETDSCVFVLDENEFKLPFSAIEKANLVYDFGQIKGEKKGTKK